MNTATSRAESRIDILGGGPAGLAVGFYAERAGIPFRIYEAGARVGGNCRTLRWGDFLYDTGAHRFHDKDPRVTAEIRSLLGDDLLRVDAPSQIYWGGRFVDFPLAPYDLLRKLDLATLRRIAAETVRCRIGPAPAATNFQEMAVATYGPTLAEMFLLNYSRKLWGARTDRLSTRVAGKRLQHLDLRTFLVEALGGKRQKNAHLDGSFYYPRHGIGMVFDRVAAAIGTDRIHPHSRVTRITHDQRRLRTIVLNDEVEMEAGTVVSTLPLGAMMRALHPCPPRPLMELAASIRFRHLVLGVFRVDRDRFTENASIYFPGDEPYTRIYESKNRSEAMAPAGQTSLVLEIPCHAGDSHWNMDDARLEKTLAASLVGTGLVRSDELLAFRSHRVPYAYPILEVGFEEKARRLTEYLSSFENLHLTGRSALFEYSHIHDMFRMGETIVREIAAGRPDLAAAA